MSSQDKWPLERVLFALAGTITLVSAALSATVSKWFLVLTGLVGVNQLLYVVVGACPASTVLRRTCHLRSSIFDDTAAVPAVDARGAVTPAPDAREVTV
jgi:hypothetical protein